MESWVIWLIVAVALGVAEVVTLTLALGFIALGALAAALVGMAGLGLGPQLIAFAATSTAALWFVRPIALRHIRQPPALRSGTAALVGREALVLADVTKHAGLVRIGGEEWTARPYDPGIIAIEKGKPVDVLAIEGATALVHPRED